MFGQERYMENNKLLNRAFSEKGTLIAVHRGIWGGNIIENTKISGSLSLEMGADMFECDVSISTDGIVYAFHDGGEKRMFGINKNIQTLSAKEIDALVYLNSIGQPSNYKVERFDEIVSCFSHGELYNVDRAWGKLPETAAVLKKHPLAIRQALIKTPVDDAYLSFFNECPEKYMYMPIVYSMKEVEKALSYPNINLVGFELIAKTPKEELFQDENIHYIKSKNLFTWANAIALSGQEKHFLFGGLDDDKALLEGADNIWGAMMDKGINVIQTDWPLQLQKYRDQRIKK
jgi:Glycerophosphoryl diester phosphodiesterase